jgi:hypothetical protein
MAVWQKINLTAWFLAALLVVLLISSGLAERMCAVASAGDVVRVKLTFYGYPDNDPPNSSRIAYPGLHNQAGGSGTYDDPTTVAVKGPWRPGTRMYLPYLSKYLIVEDLCATCTRNWIDVWAGGVGKPGSSVRACQDALYHGAGGTADVEIDPPAGKPVNAGVLC